MPREDVLFSLRMVTGEANRSRRTQRRTVALAVVMLATIVAVAAVGVLDERALASRIREDLMLEQSGLAGLLADELRAGLARPDTGDLVAPQALLPAHTSLESSLRRVLLWSDAAPDLRTLQGDVVDLPDLAAAAARGEEAVWLTPADAVRLGLPAELAVAGLARVDAGERGRWSVIAVGSALRQREREAHRMLRTIIVVSLTSLVVAGFGLVLLRTQRHELALTRALEREELRTQQEAQLAREGRAATMLTFAAGIAHELSTPLGVIATRAEQLEGAVDDERSRRGARAISEQVSRIRELARRFLAMARGAAPLRERFPVADVLRNAAARVQHRFDRAQVALAVDLGAGSRWIRGDARLLEHALTNLLLNACDASPPGGAVELGAAATDTELTLVVADRGPGIDPSLVSRIEPFFSTKAEGAGTGLGLAIASEVIRMHRGQLTLRLRDGGGTLAMLQLPIHASGPADVLAHQDQD